jgi:SAM-dependent methyltransferase
MSAPPRIRLPGSWYDYPAYYDIAMQGETKREIAFAEAVWRKHGTGKLRRILEPGCGTGRLTAEAAARGYRATGFDRSGPALDYLRRRLARRRLSAEVATDDLAEFSFARPFDLLHCFCNTFRHLRTPESARRHLRSAARALRPGGLYLLGLHLFPIDADPLDSETWRARRGRIAVNTTLTVVRHCWESRTEVLRVTLDVDHGAERFRIRSWMPLRLWSVDDLRVLLASIPALELVGVYDFVYDVDDPVTLDEYSSDVVLALARR